MPSTYPGNPSAAQAPGLAPSPEGTPSVAVPIDTDPPNAATFAQLAKWPADWVTWLMRPFSIGTSWTEKLRRFRDARGRNRFTLDHWALPAGKFDRWVEGWQGNGFTQAGNTNVNAGPYNKWRFIGTATNSASSTFLPGVVAGDNYSNQARSLKIQLDGGATAQRTEMRLDDLWVSGLCSADTIVIMRTNITLVSVSAVNWVFGFTSEAELINGINHGIFIIRPDSPGTNFKCRTINGGSPTEVDSGVIGTAGVSHDVEIHYVGANVCDDSAAHALFFIDGALVANITTNIPNGSLLIPDFGGTTTSSPFTNQTMVVGPVEYTQITGLATP